MIKRSRLIGLTSALFLGTYSMCAYGQHTPTPNTPAPDYVNRALLFGGFAVLFISAAAFFCRKYLIRLKRESVFAHIFSEVSEWILAIVISVVVSFFDLFKSTTWETPTPDLVGKFTVWVVFIVLYIVVKAVGTVAKKQDSEELKMLRTELASEKVKSELLLKQRNSWIGLNAYVRKIIDKKLTRMLATIAKPKPLTIKDAYSALAPESQLGLLVSGIWQYFAKKREKEDTQLRLAIYTRSPQDTCRLMRIHTWDGEKVDCFSNRLIEAAHLNDPKGAELQIVKCYHSSERIRILESCVAMAKAGEFHFWPGQPSYLKSMLFFKHAFEHNGTKDALIITLDSAQEYLFKMENQEEYEDFLFEMLKRVEFELTVTDLFKNLEEETA